MRGHRDVAIVTLLCLAFTFVTILFLKLAEPTGGLASGEAGHGITPFEVLRRCG